MAIKETIAFIGNINENCSGLVEELSKQKRSLLFICKNEEGIKGFSERIKLSTKAESEFITCPKTACWEADIIVFVEPIDVDNALFDKIRDFSTQKIVLQLFCEKLVQQEKPIDIEQYLSNSKVVLAVLNSEEKSVAISGKNKEAFETIAELFKSAAYKVSEEKK